MSTPDRGPKASSLQPEGPSGSCADAPLGRALDRRDALVMAAFVPVTLALTWPLVCHLATRLPDYLVFRDHDVYNNAWALWWVKTALIDLRQDPWETRHLFHPEGSPLVLSSLSPLSGVLALPVTAGVGGLSGVMLSYNLLVLLSFLAGALGAYLLSRRVGAGRWGSWLAGLAYAFSAYHYDHVRHIELVCIEWIPLVFLGLESVLSGGGPWAKLGLALAFAANGYSSTTYLASVMVMGGLWVAVALPAALGRPGRRFALEPVMDLVLPALAAIVLMVPLLFHMGIDPAAWEFERASLGENVMFAPSLERMFWPNRHPYLGWGLLLLAGHGAARDGRARRWLLLAGIGALLALGPVLKVGESPTGLVLPYHGLWMLQGWGQSRFPDRFLVYWTLGAGIAAGLGLEALLGRLPASRRGPVGLGIVLGLCLEGRHVPLPMLEPSIPRVYERIAALPAEVPVFEVPADYLTNRFFMLYQIVHGHPIVQGHLARRTIVSYNAELLAARRAWDGAVLVVHEDLMGRHHPAGRPLFDLARTHGFEPLAQDGPVKAYRLRRTGGPHFGSGPGTAPLRR